jgi:hypothetical protein
MDDGRKERKEFWEKKSEGMGERINNETYRKKTFPLGWKIRIGDDAHRYREHSLYPWRDIKHQFHQSRLDLINFLLLF